MVKYFVCADVFPADAKARPAINIERQLHCGCDSQTFLDALTSALKEADESAEPPDLVIHNAGTDILEKDPLGRYNFDVYTVPNSLSVIFSVHVLMNLM